MFIQRIIAFFTALISLISSSLGFGSGPVEKADNFRVTTYIRGDYVQNPDSLCADDFDIITDVILSRNGFALDFLLGVYSCT